MRQLPHKMVLHRAIECTPLIRSYLDFASSLGLRNAGVEATATSVGGVASMTQAAQAALASGTSSVATVVREDRLGLAIISIVALVLVADTGYGKLQ